MDRITLALNKLKTELDNAYTADDLSLSGLELKMLNTNELLETGFIDKNVKEILNTQYPDFQKHLDEFFELNCLSIRPGEIDSIYYPDEPLPAGDYIKYFKYNVAKGALKNILFDYITQLKENHTQNNNNFDLNSDDDFTF